MSDIAGICMTEFLTFPQISNKIARCLRTFCASRAFDALTSREAS
jgi:hypothetical protein